MQLRKVYKYDYLWSHEKAQGRVSSVKDRKACFLYEYKGEVFIYGITKELPQREPGGPERVYLEIPASERARIGYTDPEYRSYIVLDEYNHCRLNAIFDLCDPKPVGEFSEAFNKVIARSLLEMKRERRPSIAVPRY